MAHEALHARVVEWRNAEATRVGMAPGAVFADHVGMKLVLVKPSSPEALKIAGARLSAEGAAALLALTLALALALALTLTLTLALALALALTLTCCTRWSRATARRTRCSASSG